MILKRNKKKKTILKSETVLIIDIRSSSIGVGAIKNFEGRDKPTLILKTLRNDVYFENKVQPKDFIERSKVNLNKTLEDFINKNNNFGKIDCVRVFYGSPWYKSFIKNIHKKEKRGVDFDTNYLKKLIKENKIFEVNKDSNILSLEKKLTNVEINGYKVQKPFGKIFTDLKISFYESIVHKETQNELLSIIKNHIKTNDIKFSSHPYTIFKVINEKFENKKTYTILNISGEITEIVVIRNGNFEQIITIPKGTHYIVREVAKNFKQDFKSSLSKIDLILNNETDVNIDNTYYQTFVDIKREWLNVIRKLTTKNSILSLPPDVFLLVDKDFKNIVLDLINDVEGYSSSFMFGRKPNVTILESDIIYNLVHYQKDSVKDPFIALESGYIEVTE